MNLIILLPALACCVALARGSAQKALINVYLPAVLLLPQYFYLRYPHLPPLTFADAAMLPLGVAMVWTQMRRWRWSWMDLWVLLFAASAALSEGLNTLAANGGLQLFAELMTVVLPYMAGKLLIEQDVRREGFEGHPGRRMLMGRMVVLLAIVACVSVYDFVAASNSWQIAFRPFFPGSQWAEVVSNWPMQVRWGFGRIAGPYAHAILAGMIFLMGVFYCLWLRGFAPNWGRRRLVEGLPVTGRGLALAAIAAGLLMTQSRGPWVGVGLALIFALLTRVLPWGKAAMVFALLVMALAMGAYSFGKQYTEKELSQASNEEQRDAIYRRDLLRNYAPIIMERKAFGWGISAHPEVNGQTSIDNEFLMLAVTQGFTGLGLFLAIVAGTATRLFRLAGRPLWPEDRGLVFAQLAILIGLMITLLTVFLGEQTLILFFLIAGWVQAMNPVALGEGSGNTSAQRFRFNRVMT
jgi:O-antigen ligase